MLTIKNLRPERLLLLLLALTAALVFTGCKPAGARALLQGKKLLDQGKPAEAIAPLQNAATLLGTNALAWNLLALANHAAAKPDAATTAYQNAIAANPNLAEPYFNFGCLLLEQGNPAAARNALTSFTALRPRDANGWLKLGLAQLRTRDLPNAERSYATALNLTQTPEGWNGLGLVQAGQRARARDAVTSFSNALRLQADYAPALLNLGVIFQSQNNRAAALEKYRAYADLKNSPPNQDAVAALVKSLDAELNPPVPVAPVLIAAKTNAANATPVVSNRPAISQPKLMVVVSNPAPRVSAPVKTNLPVQVVTLTNDAPVKIAVDVSPTTPAPLFTNAVIVPPAEPKPKPVVIARYNFHALGTIKPGNRALATAAFERGIAAQDERSLTNALAAFREAVLADPSYFKAHYNLAWTAYALKDWPTALEAYEHALALDPTSTDARYNFALTLKQAGYPLDAANELEKLLAKKPEDAAGHFLLAKLYSQQLGGIELARPHYQKVLELNPQHPQATQIRYWLTENP